MTTPTEHGAPSRRRDLFGRGLMAFNALLTLAVFVNGLLVMAEASEDRLMAEGWRTFGYLVFSVIWALLALRPRRVPALWELIFLHKLPVTVLAFTLFDTTEGMAASIADSWVLLSTLLAYALCRGWESWRLLRRADPPATAA